MTQEEEKELDSDRSSDEDFHTSDAGTPSSKYSDHKDELSDLEPEPPLNSEEMEKEAEEFDIEKYKKFKEKLVKEEERMNMRRSVTRS